MAPPPPPPPPIGDSATDECAKRSIECLGPNTGSGDEGNEKSVVLRPRWTVMMDVNVSADAIEILWGLNVSMVLLSVARTWSY
jgi:hypothetical protein